MRVRRLAIAAPFAAALAAIPASTASAQYYPYPPCSPFPLAWPFCVAGAIVGVAATIVTAPFRMLAGAPPYWGYYGPPPYPPPPGYYPGYPPSQGHPPPQGPAAPR